MTQLWKLYHDEMPAFLQEFTKTSPMLRLKNVGMNCGCEYTSFPLFAELQPYSRYDHSVGVALIVWHFTQSMEQTLAALFHDVTTPVFAHVVDFLNGDHLCQESTEMGVAECLAASTEIGRLLDQYKIPLETISDYHQYPIADNDSPALSADRLEYTMGNLLNYHFADLETLRKFYGDLTIGTDEAGKAELVFRTPEVAAEFAKAALRTARVYVADEDRFAMQALADLLRKALDCTVLTRADLQQTEPVVIEKLRTSPVCAADWKIFCGYSDILRCHVRPKEGYWVQVEAKKRWIHPIAMERGRVKQWDAVFAAELERFCQIDFSIWLSAK